VLKQEQDLNPFSGRRTRAGERMNVRSEALTAVNVGLSQSSDVVSACAATRGMAARLGFAGPAVDELAAALAASGGAMIAAGGRGGAMVVDASDAMIVCLRVILEARVVSFSHVEAALVRRSGPSRYRPAIGLPHGPFHWDAVPVDAPSGARATLTLWRARAAPGDSGLGVRPKP
jgi:hypothetical protein